MKLLALTETLIEPGSSDAEWWLQVLQMVGVPMAILIVLGLAMWRTARWLRPWVERVLNSHLQFVDGTAGKLDSLCEKVEGHTESVDRLVKELRAGKGCA